MSQNLPPRLQTAVNEACAQTGLMWMSLHDFLQVFEDDEEDAVEIAFILSQPQDATVVPSV